MHFLKTRHLLPIAEVEITDPAGFQNYVAKAIPTLAGYNARLLTRSHPRSKEGSDARWNESERLDGNDNELGSWRISPARTTTQ